MGIDLLAISAWSSQGNYARVGYEVKVSRSDLRRELLKPGKRTSNVAWCNEFYFAVPTGLMTEDEIAFTQPDWTPLDFRREPCPYSRYGDHKPGWNEYPGVCRKGKRDVLFIGPLRRGEAYRNPVVAKCDGCDGKGYTDKSRVEREGPTLWVPPDVGLVTVDGRGCHVVKRSPRRKEVPACTPHVLGQLVRFVSIRPDPRHHRSPAS